MEWLTSPEIWVAFFTLTALEIVLGIDNIIMIAILVGRMPPHLQARTRLFGLALAMVTRILLLLSSKKPSDLATPAGKAKLVDELTAAVRESIPGAAPEKGIVTAYLGAFVIQ